MRVTPETERLVRSYSDMLADDFPGLDLETLVSEPEKLTERDRATCRVLSQRWLHFFTVFVLGYDLFGGPGTFHWRKAYELQEISMPTLVLWYREAFKTTLFATARPLWRAANDPAHYDEVLVTWDPKLGVQRMRERRKLIEYRPQIRVLFPELAPSDYDWSDHSMSIEGRSPQHGSPTFELRRIKQSIAGRHVCTLTADDLVNVVNADSEADQAMLKERIDHIWPTLQTDEFLIAGTLYKDYDLYSYLIEQYWPHDLQVTVQPVRGTTDFRLNDTGQIVVDADHDGPYAHPTEWDDERYEQKKRQMPPYIFYCQYHLDSSHKGQRGFNLDNVQYMSLGMENGDAPSLSLYMGLDSASGSGTSRPAIVIVGIDEDMNFYVRYVDADAEDEPDYVDRVFNAYRRFKPVMVGLERYGQGGHSMFNRVKAEMRKRGLYFVLKPMTGSRHTSKNERIRVTLRALYRQERVWHDPSVRGSYYENEMARFPDGDYDDCLDAAAYAVQLAEEYGYREPQEHPSIEDERIERIKRDGDKVALTLEQLGRFRFPDDEDDDTGGGWW